MSSRDSAQRRRSCASLLSAAENVPRFLMYDLAVMLSVNCKTPQRVAKVVKAQANGTKSAKVDREFTFLDRLATRIEMVMKIDAPPVT